MKTFSDIFSYFSIFYEKKNNRFAYENNFITEKCVQIYVHECAFFVGLKAPKDKEKRERETFQFSFCLG